MIAKLGISLFFIPSSRVLHSQLTARSVHVNCEKKKKEWDGNVIKTSSVVTEKDLEHFKWNRSSFKKIWNKT